MAHDTAKRGGAIDHAPHPNLGGRDLPWADEYLLSDDGLDIIDRVYGGIDLGDGNRQVRAPRPD